MDENNIFNLEGLDRIFSQTLERFLETDRCCACGGRGFDQRKKMLGEDDYCSFCKGSGEKNFAAISATRRILERNLKG